MKRLLLILLMMVCAGRAEAINLIGSGVGAGCADDCTGTVGSTSGTQNIGVQVNQVIVTRVALTCEDTPSEVRGNIAHVESDSREVIFVIYADNGAGTDPAELIWYGNPVYDSALECKDCSNSSTARVSIGIETVNGTTVTNLCRSGSSYIWVGALMESSATYIDYTGSIGNGRFYTETSFSGAALDATWPIATDTLNLARYSYYIKY